MRKSRVCDTDGDVSTWVIVSPQALVAHAHTAAIYPVLEQALMSLCMWQCLKFPYTWFGSSQQQSCLPLRATGTPEEGGNGKVWPCYYNCTSATSNWSEEFLTLQIIQEILQKFLEKDSFVATMHDRWDFAVEKRWLETKRTIFFLVPSSWLLYLRYLRFERPLLNLNFSCCLFSNL